MHSLERRLLVRPLPARYWPVDITVARRPSGFLHRHGDYDDPYVGNRPLSLIPVIIRGVTGESYGIPSSRPPEVV